MSLTLIPFTTDYLADAARLLAQRHARDRQVLSALPARFEDPSHTLKAVEAAWGRQLASGVVALDGDHVIGYLIGDLAVDTQRGRSVWVRQAGHAVAPDVDPEVYRDMYAQAGQRWLTLGAFDHYAMVPTANRDVLDKWYALSFGQEQSHALRPITEADTPPVLPAGVTIRLATMDDRGSLADMSPLISRQLAKAPCWGASLPEGQIKARAGYAELVDDTTATVYLAEVGGQAQGFLVMYETETSDEDMLTPDGCIELGIAATGEDQRSRGIGQALTQYALADARTRGYQWCMADWRETTLLASRFWPRQGFRRMVYRLVRRVDQRILWATGQ